MPAGRSPRPRCRTRRPPGPPRRPGWTSPPSPAARLFGLLPVALQGTPLYAPLAWVIIGGLVTSTLVARLATPVLYLMLKPPLT